MARRPFVSFTEAQLTGWVDAYRDAHDGRLPWFGSTDRMPGQPVSWYQVHAALREGRLDWATDRKLADWLARTYPGVRSAAPGGGPDITEAQVRRWVEQYRNDNDGRFPSQGSGQIEELGLTWHGLNGIMADGRRGWSEKISLANWLDRAYPDERRKAELSEDTVRQWVEDFRSTHDGRFPHLQSGPVDGQEVTWALINHAFEKGVRGLPAAGNLARWLDGLYPDERIKKGPLSEELLRSWVDAYRAANDGAFPLQTSGPIPGTHENWAALNAVMQVGQRGWTSRLSLSKWMDQAYPEQRVVNETLLRQWVDGYRREHNGKFPHASSGPIPGAARDWSSVNTALNTGNWQGGDKTTLRAWLDRHYADTRKINVANLTYWVDQFRLRHNGELPHPGAGDIPEAGTTWHAVNRAMITGDTYLDREQTLAAWLDHYLERKVGSGPLTVDQVRDWVEQYRTGHAGRLPTGRSGTVPGADLTWRQLDECFQFGLRKLPRTGGLGAWMDHEYPAERAAKPALTPALLHRLVQHYRAEHGGRFPSKDSGRVAATEDTWSGLDAAMQHGLRGWRRPQTLAAWIKDQYPDARLLTENGVRGWVDAYRQSHGGRFPNTLSGPIEGTTRSWQSLNDEMRQGRSGWDSRLSLHEWIDQAYAAERLLTPGNLRRWVEDYRARHDGAFPFPSAGAIPDAMRTWRDVDLALRAAKGHIRSARSLSDWLNRAYPAERKGASDLDDAMMREWVDHYRKAHHGRFPNVDSGKIDGTVHTWCALDRRLKEHAARDDKQDSLALWLDRHFAQERTLREDNLRDWVDAYRRTHGGALPTRTSGRIEGTEHTWESLAKQMRAGQLRWSSRTSLSAWIDQNYPAKSELTLQQVRSWVDEYRGGHGGAFPNYRSGPIADTGYTWRLIDTHLKKGKLEAPAGTTLSAWLDQAYGSARLASSVVSDVQLREWVDHYRERHAGRFPARESGPIEDAGTSWRAIDGRLGVESGGATTLSAWLDRQYLQERLFGEDHLHRWVQAFRQANGGALPTVASGAVSGSQHTWDSIDFTMRTRQTDHSLRGGLAEWLDKTYAVSAELSDPLLRQWVDAYRADNAGRFPHLRSGAIPGAELTWQGLDDAMRAGQRGWSGEPGLAPWLDRAYTQDRLITDARLRQWVDAYRESHDGALPHGRSGEIDGEGMTWKSLEEWMRTGKHGWESRQTLAAWIAATYPPADDRAELSAAAVRGWVDQYRAAHDGVFPTAESGPIDGTLRTWRSVAECMAKGTGGWPQSQSLPQWLDDNYAKDRFLNAERLREWVDAFRSANDGEFPGQQSGAIPGAGWNWNEVYLAMRKGARGWTEKQSLGQWLDATYVEERTLTDAKIKTWVDAYRAEHDGRFPDRSAGKIPGTGWSWASVTHRVGLSTWLAKHYPKQPVSAADSLPAPRPQRAERASARAAAPDAGALPAITAQRLEQWIDLHRTRHQGQYPTEHAGAMPEAGRTWHQIAQEMAAGAEGLSRPLGLTEWIGSEYLRLKLARHARQAAGVAGVAPATARPAPPGGAPTVVAGKHPQVDLGSLVRQARDAADAAEPPARAIRRKAATPR